MSLSRKKYIDSNSLAITFIGPKIIPKRMYKWFIEDFVQEHLTLDFLSEQFLSLTGHNGNVSEVTCDDPHQVMCDTYSSVHCVFEIFYYDSVNYTEKSTRFSFRVAARIDFSDLDLSNSDRCLQTEADKLCLTLDTMYSGFITDPRFRLDKVRLYINYLDDDRTWWLPATETESGSD
jgi:hypothetical protein